MGFFGDTNQQPSRSGIRKPASLNIWHLRLAVGDPEREGKFMI